MTYDLNDLDTIIFDLGEVIVDLDPQAVIDGFYAQTNGNDADLRGLIVSSPHLYDYETGKMDDRAFIKHVNGLFQSEIADEDFARSWNAMIAKVSEKRLSLMKDLMKTHKVLILSNTNAMHEVYFDAMVQEKTGQIMKDFCHHAYYSHRIGHRKPDLSIYEYIIDQEGLQPSRALFLDDKEENVLAARQAGLQSEQVAYPDQIFEILGR